MKRAKTGSLSRGTQRLILVNAITPFLMMYGIKSGDVGMVARALRLLQSLQPEDHKYAKQFAQLSGPLENALHSQGAIHHFRNKCSAKKCLNCIIGNNILRSQ